MIVAKRMKRNPMSVDAVGRGEPGRKFLVFRIEAKNRKGRKAAIKKAGYEILSAD